MRELIVFHFQRQVNTTRSLEPLILVIEGKFQTPGQLCIQTYGGLLPNGRLGLHGMMDPVYSTSEDCHGTVEGLENWRR